MNERLKTAAVLAYAVTVIVSFLLAIVSLIAGILGSLSPDYKQNVYDGIVNAIRLLAAGSDLIVKLYVAIGAVLLFALRGHRPKTYGMLEIIVGLAAIFSVSPARQFTPSSALPLLTGAYIIVRGLDNISKNLNAGSRLAKHFSMMFKNPPS